MDIRILKYSFFSIAEFGLKGVLIIIVSEDGKSYNANYKFDDENFKTAAKDALEKTLKGVEWKPGTLNGKPVASQFKMPITMNFN